MPSFKQICKDLVGVLAVFGTLSALVAVPYACYHTAPEPKQGFVLATDENWYMTVEEWKNLEDPESPVPKNQEMRLARPKRHAAIDAKKAESGR